MTKIFAFHVITVGHYNGLSRINIWSFYNCGSNLPVMTDDRSLLQPLDILFAFVSINKFSFKNLSATITSLSELRFRHIRYILLVQTRGDI